MTNSPGFESLDPATTGVLFTNSLPESRHLTNQILLNGAGVAAGDVDGDGWTDLYFCHSSGSNALFRNLGQWQFQEITTNSPPELACRDLTSTGCAFADLDGDGDLDLVVNTLGNGTRIFYNDSKGRFSPALFQLNARRGAMSMALGDIDGDGYLDLYIANYRTSGLLDIPNARATFKKVAGQTVMDTFNGRSVNEPGLLDRFAVGPGGSIEENGEPDALYISQHGTNFILASFTDGRFLNTNGSPLTKPPLDWGLSVMMRDANGDGLPDLYVCNDFQSEDRFWINQGQGRFRLAPALALRHTSRFSMGVDFADINRDGLDDFLVLDMASRNHAQRQREIPEAVLVQQAPGQIDNRPQYGFNTLFLNRGNGEYSEIAQLTGIESTEWSWTCLFVDVDLDGWEDLLVSNGMERAARDADVANSIKRQRAARALSDAEIFQARKAFPRLATPNLAFRNLQGVRFEDRSEAWKFNLAAVSHGMALADLDNDGDLDVLVNNLNHPASLYRNAGGGNRLAVRLRGADHNSRGIGARIIVRCDSLPAQTQEMIAGGRYLSGDDPVRTFACGGTTQGIDIEVRWRSGRVSQLTRAEANRIYEIAEPQSTSSPPVKKKPVSPLFEDVSKTLNHLHTENSFDDWNRQPLLPHRISQAGPSAAWFDLDHDGDDDLVLGSGKGGLPALYHNLGGGKFQRADSAWSRVPASRDMAGILAWKPTEGASAILVALSNFEDAAALGPGLREWRGTNQAPTEIFGAQTSSFGPIALGALEGTGAPALFVGGRVRPGHYPAPAASSIFKRIDNRWQLDEANSRILREIGLVSSAVWTDLNGDGFAELILACEWGPIRFFKNTRGQLTAWNPPLSFNPGNTPLPSTQIEVKTPVSMNELTGHWISLGSGDLDGDGDLDLVAGNWGRNSPMQSKIERPLRIYFADFDADGTTECFESYWDRASGRYVPSPNLSALGRILPFVQSRFETHAAYAQASVEQVLGDTLDSFSMLSSAFLDSVVLLNHGETFVARPLPLEAQLAPVFGIAIMDFNNDGFEDMALAQNFFGTPADRPRLDAGQGLLLLGDGRGGFKPQTAEESGINLYGEQRAAAASDFDQDGRVDLAMTQNGASTRLFRNQTPNPGLRVTLQGDPLNPVAIGSWIQVKTSDGQAQSREIQAGSGYLSQHSATQVFKSPSQPSQILVRWPGGSITSTNVPGSSRTLLLSYPR